MGLFQQNIQHEELSSYVNLSCESFKASKLTFTVMRLRMTERQITEILNITLGPRRYSVFEAELIIIPLYEVNQTLYLTKCKTTSFIIFNF